MLEEESRVSRRTFLKSIIADIGLIAMAGSILRIFHYVKNEHYVWQIDPYKCIQCGKCATECVLTPSAVKAVHAYSMCWYCDLCGGYHQSYTMETDTAAEHQNCPVGAIKRTYIEHPFYKYDINEELCIGCGKCVKGCNAFGNKSLFLQIRHNRCVNCNECAIARVCPADAFVRLPASSPYIIKSEKMEQ